MFGLLVASKLILSRKKVVARDGNERGHLGRRYEDFQFVVV